MAFRHPSTNSSPPRQARNLRPESRITSHSRSLAPSFSCFESGKTATACLVLLPPSFSPFLSRKSADFVARARGSLEIDRRRGQKCQLVNRQRRVFCCGALSLSLSLALVLSALWARSIWQIVPHPDTPHQPPVISLRSCPTLSTCESFLLVKATVYLFETFTIFTN